MTSWGCLRRRPSASTLRDRTAKVCGCIYLFNTPLIRGRKEKMDNSNNKIWRAKDPSGEWMETTAPSRKKAESNLRYRLGRDYGMSRFRAREYDLSDIEEVR